MSSVLFADVSEFQVPVNDQYPHPFLIIRSGDGTYRDPNFERNRGWCMSAVRRGKMIGYGVYHVWRPTGDHGFGNLRDAIGPGHHPRMMIEWDLETWAGEIQGDHSSAINATRKVTIAWLNAARPASQRKWWNRAYYRYQDSKRVRFYGNAGDLAEIAPRRARTLIRLANYDANPSRPAHWAHQYTDRGACAPFGHCDMNSADGYTPRSLARRLGLTKIIETPA